VKKLPWVIFWAVAFAFVEAAVVEYMRAIYYPLSRGGFQFPMYTLEQLSALGNEHLRRLLIEYGRELATLIMLATLAAAAGRNRRESWAHFIIAFGIWDIFYYIWLKLFLNWPEDFLTWDLLFLIPVPWVAPILAPLIVSAIMIACGAVVLYFEHRGKPLLAHWSEWLLISCGGIVVIVSFCQDYKNISEGGIPSHFNWTLFSAGMVLSITAFAALAVRNRQKTISH